MPLNFEDFLSDKSTEQAPVSAESALDNNTLPTNLKQEDTSTTYEQRFELRVPARRKIFNIPLDEKNLGTVSVGFFENSNRGNFKAVQSVNSKNTTSLVNDLTKTESSLFLGGVESEIVQFNTIQESPINAEVVYNFFDQKESNINDQENVGLDPLETMSIQELPKYVKISWDTKSTKNDIVDMEALTREEIALKEPIMKTGVVTDQISSNGSTISVVDTHQLEVAISNTNNSLCFANTVECVFNTETSNINDVDMSKEIISGL